MKKTIYILLLLASSLTLRSQTTAVDFTLKDCNGVDHSLFTLLDSGNVVILVYEHECPSCLAGITNIKNVLTADFSVKKNVKVLYLDNGANACNTTKKWIQKNNLPEGLYFRYSNDFNSPYGEGMPVIVVVSGRSHKVFLKTSSPEEATAAALKTAIENALSEIKNQP
jgi:hypothetical protein